MQKFTRPITREIELGGERVAVTLDEEGLSVRPVGGRSAGRQASWAKVFCALMGDAQEPGTQEIAAAIVALKKPPRAKKADKESPTAEPAKEPTPAAVKGGGLPPLLDRLERWLVKHRPRLLEGLRPGANEAELHQLGAQLGLAIPEALKTLLAWHDGQTDEPTGRFEENWLMMSAERIATATRELDEGAAGNGAGNGWPPGWLPFLDDDAGDYLCLDATRPGAPVHAFWLGEAKHPLVAPSLAAWLEDFVTAVEAGEYHEDPERGTFLRKNS